jgi:hypothetical protein
MRKKAEPSLSIEEFMRILENLASQAGDEHEASLRRLETLRAGSLPPG